MSRVPSKPRRRTYQTGGQLPALTSDFRPIPLGRDENGEVDGQIRALAVLLRNRSNSAVYIREGPDSDDSIEISAGEDYRIWEPNGVNILNLKGENGGENVEIRVLEAHNDFDITDRIEAFARSIAHFVGTATANTTIDGQNIDLSIDDAGGLNVAGDVSVTNDVLDVQGDVGINTESDTAEIRTELVNSDVQQDINIRRADIGDLNVAGRKASTNVVGLRFRNQAVDADGNPQFLLSYVFSSAPFDGYIQNYTVRHYADPNQHDSSNPFPVLDLIGVQPEVNDGDGYAPAVNRDYLSARQIRKNSRGSAEVELLRYDSDFETVYRVEPNQEIEFQEGDGLRFLIGTFSLADDFAGDSTATPSGLSEADRWVTEISLTIGEVETDAGSNEES